MYCNEPVAHKITFSVKQPNFDSPWTLASANKNDSTVGFLEEICSLQRKLMSMFFSFRYHLGMEPTVPCRSSLLCRSLEVYSSLQFSVWSLVWYTRPWSLLAPKPTTWNMFWRMRNHSLVFAVINNTHPSPQHWPVRKDHHDVKHKSNNSVFMALHSEKCILAL